MDASTLTCFLQSIYPKASSYPKASAYCLERLVIRP